LLIFGNNVNVGVDVGTGDVGIGVDDITCK